jgi:uncharacterized delta-60 repeat protein
MENCPDLPGLFRCSVLAASLLATLPSFAANGDIDTYFGNNGVASAGVSHFQAVLDGATPPVIQADGKILVCGGIATGGPSGTDMLVIRFTADGQPDSAGFSFDGKVEIDFSGDDFCTALALQADGKIVVVGKTSANGGDFAIARLGTDGTLDATFGESAGAGVRTGKTTIDFQRGGSNADAATSVVIQADGKIVVAGHAATDSDGTDFAVVRLNEDGSRDSSFTLTGMVTLGFNAGENETAAAVRVDAAGRIVLGGTADVAGNFDFAVARLLSNGLPDANFSSDGRVTLGFDLGGQTGSQDDEALGMIVQRDGKIVLVGEADISSNKLAPNYDVAIARLQPDGSPDNAFGSNGRTLVAFDLAANGLDAGVSVVEQSNGKLIVGGYANASANAIEATVVRLNVDGSRDAQFGSLGKVVLDLGLSNPSQQIVLGVALQGTQVMVSGGASVAAGMFDAIAVRLENDLLHASGFE